MAFPGTRTGEGKRPDPCPLCPEEEPEEEARQGAELREGPRAQAQGSLPPASVSTALMHEPVHFAVARAGVNQVICHLKRTMSKLRYRSPPIGMQRGGPAQTPSTL